MLESPQEKGGTVTTSIEKAEQKLMDALEDFLTTEQAAERFGMHQKAVCKLAHESKIRAVRIGHFWLIHKDAIPEYLNTRNARGRPRGTGSRI